MSSYHDVLHPDRLTSLMEIVPRFNAHVQSNDQVLMGIAGDSLYPYEASARPSATVLDVRSDSDGIEVRMRDNATHEEFIVPKNNVDPKLLWEFHPDTFEGVLHRAMSDKDIDFVPMSAPESPRAEPTHMSAADDDEAPMVDGEVSEARQFAHNAVRVMAKLAKENLKMEQMMQQGFEQLGLRVAPVCNFSQVFREEFKAEMSDSSGSDSEQSDSETESSAASSAGSEFAADMLAAE